MTNNRRGNKILLVNPNRYHHPPVIPLALEYLAHALRRESFDVEVLDLCFAEDPLRTIEEAVGTFSPHAVGITIRNVDSVLYPNPDYFLPEIREAVLHLKGLTDAPVVIGGSALPADPEGILQYVGADVAIVGPGEETLPALLRVRHLLQGKGKVVKGIPPQSACPARGEVVSYPAYLEKDGLPGFETHKGCSSNCAYCIEAKTPLRFREPSHVIDELRQLAERGFHHLHLCDTEFNDDLGYCLDLLEALDRAELRLQWGLYMKPGNFNTRLFELLKRTGAYLVTLSVDTLRKDPAYWKDVESMISLCRDQGIRVSIDFLTGFPYENEETLRKSLDFFRKAAPDEVVVNVFLRLYERLPLTRIIEKDLSLQRFLIGSKDNGSYLEPVFYNHVPVERLRELIGGDPLFRIAGAEKIVNYQVRPSQ
jgi:radical SAM superfamily enzyme YgiQ (UPF0313 family)